LQSKQHIKIVKNTTWLGIAGLDKKSEVTDSDENIDEKSNEDNNSE